MYIGKDPRSLQECFQRIRMAEYMLVNMYGVWSEDCCAFRHAASEQDIQKLESKYDLALPEAYKEFLRLSNGAQIRGHSCTIYGTDRFGAGDPMVPDAFYTVGERNGERIALNPADGKLYSCYNGEIEPFSLEQEMCRLTETCEETVLLCEKGSATSLAQKQKEAAQALEEKQRKIAELEAMVRSIDRLADEFKKNHKK